MSKVCQSLSCDQYVNCAEDPFWLSILTTEQDPGAEAQLEPQGLKVSGVTVFDIAVYQDVNCQESRERYRKIMFCQLAQYKAEAGPKAHARDAD